MNLKNIIVSPVTGKIAIALMSLAVMSYGSNTKRSVGAGENAGQQLPAHIDVASAIGSPSPINVSQLGSTLTFLPLETSDSSLIGEYAIFSLTRDKVIVNSQNAGVKAFSLADGSYLNSISHRGQDPEAYRETHFLMDGPGDKLFFRGNGDGRWVRYATDGRFLGSFSREERLKRMTPFVVCDTVMVYPITNGVTDPDPYLSVAFVGESGAIIDSVAVVARAATRTDSRSIAGNIEMEQYDGLMRHSMQNSSGFRIGDSPMVYVSSVAQLWRVGDGPIHAMMPFSDTIYEVRAASEPVPVAVMDFGGKGFPAAENGRREMSGDEYMLTDFIETDGKIVFGTGRGWRRPETGLIGYYDKKTGITRLTAAADGFTDDLAGFMPFYPVAATPDGTLVGVLTQEDILKWVEEHPDAAVPSALQPVIDSEEEPNPVLVIVR